MTSLEAATLATTDATSPAPPSPPLPLLSSAVPSEPARCCSPCWKAAAPPAPSMLPAWPGNFPPTCPAVLATGRQQRCPARAVQNQVWFGMGVQGAAGLVCPWGGLCFCHPAGWGLEDAGDQDILEQEGSVLRGRESHTLDVPLVTAPFGAWRDGQRRIWPAACYSELDLLPPQLE